MGNRYIRIDSIKDRGIPASKVNLPISNGSGIDSICMNSTTITSKDYSYAEGYHSVSEGFASHAEGNITHAAGYSSHTEGIHTYTVNHGEHAEGEFNLPIKDKTIHTIGIGNSDIRRNALEIHKDGKCYIYGIGGYDGTNSQTAGVKTIQEVINGK